MDNSVQLIVLINLYLILNIHFRNMHMIVQQNSKRFIYNMFPYIINAFVIQSFVTYDSLRELLHMLCYAERI